MMARTTNPAVRCMRRSGQHVLMRTRSRAELPKVIVKVAMTEQPPGTSCHGPKDGVFRPIGPVLLLHEAIDQLLKDGEVGSPGGWPSQKRLRRPFGPSPRPGKPQHHDMPKQWPAQWARARSGASVAERVAHLVAEMDEHLPRGHAPPVGGSIRVKATEPGEQRLARRRIENGMRRSFLFGQIPDYLDVSMS